MKKGFLTQKQKTVIEGLLYLLMFMLVMALLIAAFIDILWIGIFPIVFAVILPMLIGARLLNHSAKSQDE